MRKIYSGRSGGNHSGSFEFIVNTATAGSSGVNNFRLPFKAGIMSMLADWGDGTSTYIDASNYATAILHNYGAAATYTVKLSGYVRGFSFGDMVAGLDDCEKLIEIVHWGDYVGTEDRSFNDCINLTHVSAKDTPRFTAPSTTQNMFNSCTSLVAINNIANWNVRTDTPGFTQSFFGMFNSCGSFVSGTYPTLTQPDLSNWDVTNVDDFRFMFYNATLFNGKMFRVVAPTAVGLENMFNSATSFNNNGSPDIQNWDVSNAVSLEYMFSAANAFNQPLNNWDVSNVTNMAQLFNIFLIGAATFNQPLNLWDVSSVQDMREIFGGNQVFDQDLSSWKVTALNINPVPTSPITTSTNGLNLSTANYDALLVAWDAYSYPSWPGGGMVFGDSTFSLGSSAETARTSLISKWGGITDGGGV